MTSALRRYPFQAMGRLCEIQFLDNSRIEARKNFRRMASEIDRLERKYSLDHPENFVAEINVMAGNSLGIKLDMETRSLFEQAKEFFEKSDGMIDVTAGVLNDIWDFDSDYAPSQDKIDELLPNVGFEKLEWKKSRLLLPENMAIDFGDIIVQYAADSVAAQARGMGIDSGLVNLGGVFAVIGPLPDDEPWPVGIMYPGKDKQQMAKLMLESGGLASCGDFEKTLLYEGKHFSRAINPKTGWPFDGLRAVCVCADLCTLAGSGSQTAMAKPEAEAIEWLSDLGVDHAYLTSDGKIGGKGIQLEDAEAESA